MKSPKMPAPPPPAAAPTIQSAPVQQAEDDLRKKRNTAFARLSAEVPMGTGTAVGKTLLGS